MARFMISGGVVIASYYAPYYLLTEFCGVWYLASSVVGSVVCTVVNFILQKFWTFENKSMANAHFQVIASVALAIGFTVVNGGMLYILVGKLHLHYLVGQIIVSSILGIVSYFISGWIFRDQTP